MLRGPRFFAFHRIVIDTDHLNNIVQDYSAVGQAYCCTNQT